MDIEAQLSNTTVKDESKDKESSLHYNMHPLQLLLLQRLLSCPTSKSVEDELKWCDDAVDAVVQYCDVLNGGPFRGWPKQIRTTSIPPIDLEPNLNSLSNVIDCPDKNTEVTLCPHDELIRTTQKHLSDALKPQACFQCFADEKLPGQTCCRMFYDAGCVTQHFDACHLHDDSQVQLLQVFLLHKMEFQRHASDIH